MPLSELIAQKTSEMISSLSFKEIARKLPQYFTRNRKMPFESLICFMLLHLKCSIPTALRRFFENNESETTMSQQSLSEARNKVNVSAFRLLYEETVKTTIEYRVETFLGYRIFAVDGSKIALPSDKRLLSYYGGMGPKADSPTAQCSALYDVLNDVLIDVAMEPLSVGERTLAERHLTVLKQLPVGDKNLIIYDRGYPSFDFIKKHETEGLYFLMRVKSKFSANIDAQTEPDGYVRLEKGGEQIPVRVIKILLDSGEMETLITNVKDNDIDINDFKDLYFLRWPVETKFGVIKDKLQVENFSSKTVEGVQQEFLAAMYVVNLIAATAYDIQKDIDEERKDKYCKYEYKVNLNELVGILKDKFIEAVLVSSPYKRSKIMRDILDTAKRHIVPVRPYRSVPRNPNPRKVKFHHNRKVNC